MRRIGCAPTRCALGGGDIHSNQLDGAGGIPPELEDIFFDGCRLVRYPFVLSLQRSRTFRSLRPFGGPSGRTSAVAFAIACSVFSPDAAAERSLTIRPSAWRVVERDSGPVNYYSVVREGDMTLLRASYRPPLETVVLGWRMPEADRAAARRLRWTWRARTLPRGGDECVSGKGDSAAVVYVTWKRGLRYYTLKYVWTSSGKQGATCARKRNPFVAQDTVVAQVGPPLAAWKTVELDLRSEFITHFEGGDREASVPDFVGVGILTDGDQTRSESAADYGTFTVIY